MSDREQNARVLINIPLLKIRDIDQLEVLHVSEHIINKYSASASIGNMPGLIALYYMTNMMIEAEFRDISTLMGEYTH